MVKNKIYQYFFKEFFKIFLLVSLSISILIWITQATRLLELITEFGNPVEVYIKYLILIYPKILDNTFLLSYLISIFFLFSKLDSAKELNIYWLSGISKYKIYKITLIISTLIIILNLLLSIFLAPNSSYLARMVLGESKFSLINSLVKEKNFNTPLKGLTIYVERNDKKGNLQNIFIYEKERTIIANFGRVIEQGEDTFLELSNGFTQEKLGNKLNYINFNKTIFDFSKYKLRNIKYPKYDERNIGWIVLNMNNKNISTFEEIREEFNKRIIKPFFSLIIGLLGCMLLFTNNEKINIFKYKIIIYLLSVMFLVFNQAIIGLSGTSYLYSIYYASFIFIQFLIVNFILKKFVLFSQ